ncbi:MAG: hypothetical protein AABY88_04770 [Pseudomonadota bacterium]
MAIEELVLSANRFSPTITDFINDAPFRTVQTNLTNLEFAMVGLTVFEPTNSTSDSHRYLGLAPKPQSEHPVLFASSDYSDLLRLKDVPVAKTPDWLPQFTERLNALDEAAIEDEIKVSKKSRKEVSAFVASLRSARMPTVFLVRNGNVRLRWSNKQGEKVGLQFRGNGEVQYLFFKRVGDKFEHMLGTKLLSTIMPFIATCGLRHVISE